jgi:hypothetical protein
MQRVASVIRVDIGICRSIRVVTTRPAVERVHPPDTLFRLLNRVMRRMIARGHFQDQLLLLHYVGRRSGRRFDVPAGYHMIDGVPSVLTSSGWRHNFAGGREIEVTLRGERRPAYALLVEEPGEVTGAYQRLIEKMGAKQARRRLGLRAFENNGPILILRDARSHSERSGHRRSATTKGSCLKIPPKL